MTDGVGLIDAERKRQILVERWSKEHDDQHTSGEIAIAACCYAAAASGIEIFALDPRRSPEVHHFEDPWPWESKWDKRRYYGRQVSDTSRSLAKPGSYSDVERLDLLVKAGALIAAEIDRLKRAGYEYG